MIAESLQQAAEKTSPIVEWVKPNGKIAEERLKLILKKDVTHLSWHRKGDYFGTVSPDGNQI